MITRAALDRLQLTAIAKVSYIVEDFKEVFEQEDLGEFPYPEPDNAKLLLQPQQDQGVANITPPTDTGL